jgi:hypothetical protein
VPAAHQARQSRWKLLLLLIGMALVVGAVVWAAGTP